MPGARVDDVTSVLDHVFKEGTAESPSVIHVGAIDITQARSKKLLDKFRRLIEQ